MDQFTKEQVKKALARTYRTAYIVYAGLEQEGKAALHEGDFAASEAIAKRALLRSQYLYGIKVAAETLGIGETEFMEAVNQDNEEEVNAE